MPRSAEARPAVSEGPGRARELLRLLGRRIRTLRERVRLTQEDFAVRCGISVSFASLLERGERSPSYETLVRVADALRISLADLFRDMTPPEGTHDDPSFVRLLELARRLRLSRAQVDRLLAVGEAMFEERAEDVPQPPRRAANACVEKGCERPVLARGLCTTHYHRARRARL